jgi:thiamine-phosphate pyrophosphorylase
VPVVLRGLYVIIDQHVADGRDVVKIAREAIAGGARIIQWRDKTREKGLQLPDVEAIADVCRKARVPLIINDDVDIALAVGADGVHVGQKDLPVTVVRRLGPFGWIVGASTNNAAEARKAEVDGADYVSVGNLFGTSSKDDTRPATLETLREVKDAVHVAVCAIGGINETNLASVIAAGADMASVISAVVAAEDPRAASERLAKRFL